MVFKHGGIRGFGSIAGSVHSSFQLGLCVAIRDSSNDESKPTNCVGFVNKKHALLLLKVENLKLASHIESHGIPQVPARNYFSTVRDRTKVGRSRDKRS